MGKPHRKSLGATRNPGGGHGGQHTTSHVAPVGAGEALATAGGGDSTADPQRDVVLTTNLQRMVAPWAHAVGWVLSPGWISGAEGWVGSVGTLQQWPCHPFRRRPVASGRGFVCCFGRASHGDGTCASTIVPPCAAGDTVGAGEAVSQQGLQPPELSLCHQGKALVVPATVVTVTPATTAVPCHHHSFVPHCHHATLCLHHGHHSPRIPLALQPPCPHQNPAVPRTLWPACPHHGHCPLPPQPPSLSHNRPVLTSATTAILWPPQPLCPPATTATLSLPNPRCPPPTMAALSPTQPPLSRHSPSVPLPPRPAMPPTTAAAPVPIPGRSPLPAGPPAGAGLPGARWRRVPGPADPPRERAVPGRPRPR